MNFFKLKQLFFSLKLKKLKRDQKKFIFKKLLYSLFSLPIIFLVQKYQTKKKSRVYTESRNTKTIIIPQR